MSREFARVLVWEITPTLVETGYVSYFISLRNSQKNNFFLRIYFTKKKGKKKTQKKNTQKKTQN